MDGQKKSRARRYGEVVLVSIVSIGIGAGLVYFGGRHGGFNAYDKSIFVNVGTAIALAGPLFGFGWLLSKRLDQIEVGAQEAKVAAATAVQDVVNLTTAVRAQLNEDREEDEALREQAKRGADQADLVAVYERAGRKRELDRLGLRLPVDPLGLWIRVRALERAPEGEPEKFVELSFEDQQLEFVGPLVIWSPGEDVRDVFVRLATGLRDADRYHWPGDDAFDADAIFASIVDALGRIIELRAGPGADPELRVVAALPNMNWAVTREGLDCLMTAHLWADTDELVGDSHHAFQRLEHGVKVRGWDAFEFREAFAEAECIHTAFNRHNPPNG